MFFAGLLFLARDLVNRIDGKQYIIVLPSRPQRLRGFLLLTLCSRSKNRNIYIVGRIYYL